MHLLLQMGVPEDVKALVLTINVIAERFCATADLSMLEPETRGND